MSCCSCSSISPQKARSLCKANIFLRSCQIPSSRGLPGGGPQCAFGIWIFRSISFTFYAKILGEFAHFSLKIQKIDVLTINFWFVFQASLASNLLYQHLTQSLEKECLWSFAELIDQSIFGKKSKHFTPCILMLLLRIKQHPFEFEIGCSRKHPCKFTMALRTMK